MICIRVLGLSLYSDLQIYDKTVQRYMINPRKFFFSPRNFSREVTYIVKQVSSIIICLGQGVEGRKEKYIARLQEFGHKQRERRQKTRRPACIF